MRIISGTLKGKPINFLKSSSTRPLKDSVKENIFNIIAHSNEFNINIEKSNVLDLYSGIGSFGLECISRGANKVTFVEKDKNVVEILNDNLVSLDASDKASIIVSDIRKFFEKKQLLKYEIIFFDPPFRENTYIGELETIKKTKIYNTNHIVIIHREKKQLDDFKEILKPLVIKKYGRSKIIFGKFLK